MKKRVKPEIVKKLRTVIRPPSVIKMKIAALFGSTWFNFWNMPNWSKIEYNMEAVQGA